MNSLMLPTRSKQPGSLPAIDTTEADKRHDQLQAKQDNQDSSTTSKQNTPSIKRKVFIETRSKTFAGITVIEWENGVITVRPEQSAPDFVANYTPEQKAELLQLAIQHLSKQKAEKAANKEAMGKALSELDDMQKSIKPTVTPPKQPTRIFHGIIKPKAHKSIPQAVKTAEKVIQKETVQMEPAPQPVEKPRQSWFQNNRYFDPKGTPTPGATPQPVPPTTPAPSMSQSIRNSRDTTPLTGHQLAARRVGCDINTPGLEKMNLEEMKATSHKQTLEATEPLFLASGKLYRR